MVNVARVRYFTDAVLPTHTVVGAAALAQPQFVVEISAVAYLGSR